MSGPFRFNQEAAKSPLDRSASPFSTGQPVSFKTNVNRMKTKKWVQAKKNAYDGDDWGEYDEYDEYGVNDEPPLQQEPPSAQRYFGQPTRSFTEPSQAPLPKARRNSFEHGEEQRAFSSTIPHPQQSHAQQDAEPHRQTSGAESDIGHDPQQRRDFSPSAMPTPLQTRISAVPLDMAAAPPNSQFPPRKSSIGQVDSPVATSPRSRTGSQSDKPLPFIRPADIYKRVGEERERERASLDSSRPSLDSLSSRPKDEVASPQLDGGRLLQPLETVAERKSEYLANFDPASHQNGNQPLQVGSSEPSRQERPPQLEHFNNNSPWTGGPQVQASGNHAPVVALPDDHGFRSVVDQAFTRNDDQRSIPPTPISQDSSSDMVRSNTGSTVGISPIMSRAPGSATSALKNRNQVGGEGSTPAIEEEPSETATPVSQSTSAFVHEPPHHFPQQASGHSRNFSGSSLPRSGLATPTRGDSPARSPVIAPQEHLPVPKSGQLAIDTSDEMQGGLSGPSPAYAVRESDIATAMKSSPIRAAPELRAAERQSQDTFLESHNAQSPIQDVVQRDRSESPSKGRVQALAGKFGDVSHSRRGSTQSNTSRNSVQSWERSRDHSRAASPTKSSPSKPSSPVKEFRPHLPGQWESYATTAITPSDLSDRDEEPSFEKDKTLSPLGEVDLTPTTAKRPVTEIETSNSSDPITALKEDPIAALRDAGAAMVNSIRTTVGLDDSHEEQRASKNHGDVYMPRPLQLDRTISSVSSVPPTPPAKDPPESEFPPPPPLKDLEEKTPEPLAPELSARQQRPTLDSQLSTDPSAEDQESDRLRKEIVASLSPVRTAATLATEPNRASLQPASPGNNRASSILPSEYDSYWAEGDQATPRASQDVERNVPALSSAAVIPPATQTEDPARPAVLNRFSWEGSTPGSQLQTVSAAEPTKSAQDDKLPSPAIERAAEEERQQWSESLPNPYFGPGHTFTVTKPDPVTEADMGESARSLAGPPREHTRSPGLHVVNTEVDPEAVDLPPRISAEYSQPPRTGPEEPLAPQHEQKEAEALPPAPVSQVEESRPSFSHEPTAKSPTTHKPLGAREIATITSAQERIATYNKTRDHWATTDHGLENWLVSTVDAKPDLATQAFPVQRPPTGTIRHKQTASLSLLGKLGGSSNHPPSGTEQYNTASAQAPGGSSSPTTGSPSGPGFSGRVPSHQMQAKGKDLLHTAGVLSGKGMTSAKGLFAKGKSRFGRDKAHSRTDSAPSSREPSEEPEFITPISRASTATTTTTTTPEKPLNRASTAIDSPNDEKKRRRFSLSSPFHLSNRSRSRPSSIALPSTTPSVFGTTPKNTPPRELSAVLGQDGRPHSFHAPDSWNYAPGLQPSFDQGLTTPPGNMPQLQSRLGILPSPAKSAFSLAARDVEQDVPPVPPLPDTVSEGQYQGKSQYDGQYDASHKMLQSTIRYSTPPIPSKEAGNGAESPVLVKADATVERAADTEKALPPVPAELEPGQGISTPEDLPPSNSVPVPGAASLLLRTHAQLDDDDDRPPQLNHDPLPPATHAQPIEASTVVSSRGPPHHDVSDDEDEDDRFPGVNGASTLHAPRGRPLVRHVSPLLPPAKLALDDVPHQQRGLQSVGSIPHIREMQQEAGGFEEAVLKALDKHPGQDTDVDGSDDEFAVSAPEQANEPVPRSGDQQQAFTPKRPLFETELIGGDISPVSNLSHKFDNDDDNDATPKAASGPARHDLRLPKVRGPGGQRLERREDDPIIGPQLHLPEPVSQQSPTTTSQFGDFALDGASLSPGRALSPHLHANAADPAAHHTRRVSATPLQVVHAVEEYAASNSSLASWDHDSAAAKSPSETGHPDEMRDESHLVTPLAQIPRITHNGPPVAKAEALHDHTSNTPPSDGYFRGLVNSSDPQQLQPSRIDETFPERSKSILSQISAMVSEGGNRISPASSSAGRSTPSTIRRMQHDSSAKSSWAPTEIPEESTTAWNDQTPTVKDDGFDLYADHNGIVKDVRDESGRPLRVSDARIPESVQLLTPTKPAAASKSKEQPRSSPERPMSFTSGPPDQDGKPQDQINQLALANDMPVPPVPEQYRQPQQSGTSVGTAHLKAPSATVVQLQTNIQPQHQSPSEQPSLQSSVSSSNDGQDTNTNNVAIRALVTSPLPSAQTSVRPPSLSERPPMNGQAPQNSQLPAHGWQDPRIFRMAPGQPPAPRQVLMPDHDPRTLGHPVGPPPKPKDQHEFQKQIKQLQAKYPRARGVEKKTPPLPAQQPSVPKPKTQEKPSSMPRLSSVFKGFGGKSHVSQQNSHAPNTAMNSTLKPLPADPNRNGSFHSAISNLSLSRESTSTGRPGEQPGPMIPSNRPPSMGENSRKTASPASFHAIPPHQPPNGAPMPSEQLQPQPQSYRASTSGVPEMGKKKRFSTLGGLLNRTGLANDGPRLSREERKALKAQRNSTPPPAQANVPHWAPQQQPFQPQQPGVVYPPGQDPQHMVSGMRPLGPQFASPQDVQRVQGAQGILPQMGPQQHPQSQPGYFPQQPIGGVRPEEGSAYLRTRQLAEEHQAQRVPTQSSGQGFSPGTQADKAAYAASQAAQQQALQQRLEAVHEHTAYGGSQEERLQLHQHQQSIQGQGVYSPSHVDHFPAEQWQRPMPDQGAYAEPQAERIQALDQRVHPTYHQEAYGASQAERQNAQVQREQQMAEQMAEQMAYQAFLAQHQAAERQRQPPISDVRGYGQSQEERLAQQYRQQQEQQMFQQQQRQSIALSHRSAYGPIPSHVSHAEPSTSQRHVSSPMTEPQYEAPPIPAAYNHVSGAFVFPLDRQEQPMFPPFREPAARPSMDQYGRQYSDPRMSSISPQISAQSQMPSYSRTHSDVSTMSVVSPISISPDVPISSAPPNQRPPKPRMSSISEVHLQEQPWHLNFPVGATEQEIVRARQRQYMEQQFTAQQQLHAERVAQSPSPHIAPHGHSPALETQRQGGYKELLPKSSPQPYPAYQAGQSSQVEPPQAFNNPRSVQPGPIHPDQTPLPAAYPLPMSPESANIRSPVNPLAGALAAPPLPPPKLPHSPMRPMLPPTDPSLGERQQQHFHPDQQHYETPSPPQATQQQDEHAMLDEAPPSYDGPGMPNDGMDKSSTEHSRSPNIRPSPETGGRGQAHDPRQRQPSLGLLQHPQPASMAASPQRSSADMGAESLRRQLLQQEEHSRMERIQRAQIQRAETEREKQEREIARARARELERSASGGGKVGSLRSVGGSRNGGTIGWERQGSSSRPVFELPAVDDDEPDMKATSYPGQEWVPPMWTDD